MFNSTTLDCNRKFNNFWGSSFAVRKISDLLCWENGLSVIENPKPSRAAMELGWAKSRPLSGANWSKSLIQTVALAVRTFGKVDILLSNAGIGISGPFLESTMADYDLQMNTNVRSCYAFCLHTVPELIKNEESQLIIVSSVTGLNGHAYEVAYSGTKFANRGIAQALNREFREQGLKVCTLCPSATNTSFEVGSGRTEADNNARLMLLPEDLADAVVFICKQSKGTSRVMEMSLASMSGN